MRQSTLVFVFNPQNQILLAMKKRGFGEGKWNGAGGKVEAGETIVQAANRELAEETGISIAPEKLEARGVLHFHFSGKPEWDQDVSIFVSHGYTGSFEETEEMKPEWFDTDTIPFDDMWEDDIYWLPRVIDGESVEFEFYFGEDGLIEEFAEVYGG
ncbi:MAG: 8-oxo-dGTP diphosphatase [Candidatus Gracilibacteria bacterium]|nr:8-oxo-dGTP diphosphatase [Candidatus Gracilibacteria bacterium]